MNLDAATFVMSLSLDALLCCGISAALTRALASSSEALWNWSGAMICFAVSFILLYFSAMPGPRSAVLTLFVPHAFGVAGSMSLFFACLSINGRRIPRWSSTAAVLIIGAIASTLTMSDSHAIRASLTLAACASFTFMGACAFATERRWREGFGGLLAILSVLSMAVCCAASALVEGLGGGITKQALAPYLFFFEAAFLSSSFAFILCVGELARSQALDLSLRDGLTGLLNKRAFFEAANPTLSRARRSGACCAFLMIDIDFFKRINDTHGHLAGDAAIVHASVLISRSLRASDVCARFGGEEFCALLSDTDVEGALRVANRILDSSRAEPALHQSSNGTTIEMPFTLSIGVHVQKIDDSDDAASLLAHADTALYASKRSGRDRLTLSRALAKD